MIEMALWYVKEQLHKNAIVFAVFENKEKKSFFTHGAPDSPERGVQLEEFSDAEKFLYLNEAEATELLNKAPLKLG